MDKFSFLGALHTGWVEDMYDKYLQDPQSIEEEWSNFFQGFDFAKKYIQKRMFLKFFRKNLR